MEDGTVSIKKTHPVYQDVFFLMQRQSLQKGAMIFIEAYKKIDFFTDFITRNLAFDTLLRYTENKSRWFWYIF